MFEDWTVIDPHIGIEDDPEGEPQLPRIERLDNLFIEVGG